MQANQQVVFENVSKFYGDVLGVNRVTLSIPPGITSLVGPNGSGKTTLMNLMTGLLKPTRGRISVLGISPDNPEEMFRQLGYCSQFDSFPRGFTGYQFVYSFLRLYGCTHAEAEQFTWASIDRVNMRDAAHRKIAGYSKGMRQRIKLAQSTCHGPSVLVLDEPLNGLDPLVRAEVIALLRSLAEEGMHIIISSHVLHEVDMISDQVILLSNGYVVAEGKIRGVRNELDERPMQILIRCNHPSALAAKVFEQSSVVEARMHADGRGLLVKTRDPDKFYLQLNKIAMNGIGIESVTPADDDVNSLYEYLIGSEEGESMKTLWLTQIAAVLRLEMRKTFFSRRGLWIYILALLPILIFGGHSFFMMQRGLPCDFGKDTNIFASVFQLLDLRVVIFFGCLGIFMNLFRGEVLDRSLHYYFLAPIRREVLVVGKYLSGIIAAIVIFTTSTLLQWVAMYAHFPWTTVSTYLRDGNGWSHLAAYAGTTVLGCIGYGSLFLLTGAIFRNPIFPAAGVFLWEGINAFVPTLLQKFSVIYYLKSLCPIEAPPGVPPPLSLLIVNADPIEPSIAICGMLLFTLLVVFIAALQVRRMEINYGTD